MSTLLPNGVAPWRQKYWDWRAAGNFIGGGSGTGLLAYAALVSSTAAPVILLGMALVCAGLLCVWLEIGRPWRALNVFRRPNSSWMAREALTSLPLLACGLVAAVTGRRPPVWLGGAIAVFYMYCQARMLNAGRGIPAWRHPRLVPLLLASGLAEGSGFGVLAQMLAEPAARPDWSAWLVAGFALARLGAFAAYRSGLATDGAPRGTLAVLGRFAPAFQAANAAVVAAAVLAATTGAAAGLIAAAGAVSIAAGWWLKFTLVVRAAYNQGFALPETPVRGTGAVHPGARPGW